MFKASGGVERVIVGGVETFAKNFNITTPLPPIPPAPVEPVVPL